MTCYEMQFHAESDELIEDLRDAIHELAPVRRICLGRMDLNEGGFITAEDFLAVNRDCLAIAVDPTTGALVRAPEHRHTPGAHALAADGVKMLACAGQTYFEFDDVLADWES